MHENSHHDPYTREEDSRIFPFAKIMRKARIDELPQMINILKGDLHLIADILFTKSTPPLWLRGGVDLVKRMSV